MQYNYYFMKNEVWSKAMDLNCSVYKICDAIKGTNTFAIIDQLRRSSLSVPTNIAEGLSKESFKEQLRFLGIVYASLMEVLSLLLTLKRWNIFIVKNDDQVYAELNETARLINGYRKHLKTKL